MAGPPSKFRKSSVVRPGPNIMRKALKRWPLGSRSDAEKIGSVAATEADQLDLQSNRSSIAVRKQMKGGRSRSESDVPQKKMIGPDAPAMQPSTTTMSPTMIVEVKRARYVSAQAGQQQLADTIPAKSVRPPLNNSR